MGEFRGVSLQATLFAEVAQFIKEQCPTYRSVAEFVSEATRLRLEALTQNKEAK